MVPVPEKPEPKTIELDARALWARERLPPPNGIVGPTDGPIVHELEGSFAPQEYGMLVVQRAVAADVDARSVALSGRRATGFLRREDGGPPTPGTRLEPILRSLGVWIGGDGTAPFVTTVRAEALQTIAGRLAHSGVLAVRDVALRVCPTCAVARDPERIVYREENGDTLLVRFPFAAGDRPVSALVWTDSAWRLLGTSALLIHPELPYVVARYRRDGAEELVFTSRSSLDRIRRWLHGAEIEVVEEHPGKHWVGTAYVHPLRHEFPLGGGLEPPAGTILAIPEVSDTGTGVVPLVPGHGGNDAVLAERLGVPGWPLVTTKGRFDITLVHKYAGLELDSGDDFVGRDLSEDAAIFARLRVRRGVPHCVRCGSGLIWAPGRAWCLEASHLPPAALSIYRSVLPRAASIERLEAVPWPVSEPQRSDDPLAVTLLECSSCDRLDAPTAEGDRCACGGRRRPVRRRLLPGFEGAAAAWGPLDPLPPADAVRLFINERRRAPALVHHLAAMSGVGGTVGDVRVGVLPTVPEVDLPALIAAQGADAIRAALVRAQGSEGRTETFRERCVQERARLDRWVALARAYVSEADPTALATYAQPIGGFVGELEPEDRSLLARFERMRVQALAEFDRGNASAALRRVFRFLEQDFSVYHDWTRARRSLAGSATTKRAALRTTAHVLLESTRLLAPIAPHTAEAVHASLAPRRASVFQEVVPGVDRALLDDERAKAWDRWVSVVRALDRYRREAHLPNDDDLPAVVLIAATDGDAESLRAEAPILERLARARRFEIASPSSPWAGRRRQLRPVESEIQRVYPSRASQIIHLLKRTSERKIVDPGPQGFSITVNGQPTQILPSMLDWVETLPERYVPVAWRGGEMYVETPANAGAVSAPPPPLSSDAFELLERARRQLGPVPAPERKTAVLLVAAAGGVGAQIAGVAAPAATYLGIRDVRVVGSERELPGGHREVGREHAGARWAFHLTGVAARTVRPKSRPVHARGDRIRPAFAPAAVLPSVANYSDDEWVLRHNAVRALGDELDQLLERTLLGPSKVDAAWEAGFRSLDDFRRADWDTIVALPGFGRPIAAELVQRLGGTVPPPPPRPARRRAAPSPEPEDGAATVDAAEWTPPEPAELLPPAPSVPLPTAPRVARPAVATYSAPPAPPLARPASRPIAPAVRPVTPAVPASAPVPATAPAVSPPPGRVPAPDPPQPPAAPPTTGDEPAPVVEPVAPNVPLPAEPTELIESISPLIAPPEEALPAPPVEPALPAPELEPELPPPAVQEALPPGPDEPELGALETPPPSPAPREGDAGIALPGPDDSARGPGTGGASPVPDLAPPEPTPLLPSAPEPGPGPHIEPAPPVVAAPIVEIPVPAMPPVEPTPLPPPPVGGIELDVGPSYLPSLERFLDATAAGHPGVCIVRDSPERVRAFTGSRPVEIRWLTNIGRGATLKPTDLEGLSGFLRHAVTEGKASAFFLEGIEYLVRLHGLDRMVTELSNFDRLAREQSARVWLHLNPKLLSADELARFESAFPTPRGPGTSADAA